MAITFERTVYQGYTDPFWRKEVQVLPGGFAMTQTFPIGEVIPRGVFVNADTTTLKASIVKIGKVLAGGTTTAARVTKNNCFCVGDVVMKVGASSTTTVKSVDRSNPSYDVIEFAAAISGLVENDFVQEADSSKNAPKYVANAVLAATLEIQKSGLPVLDVAYSGILVKSLCVPFPASWLLTNGFCLTANPHILVINQ